jgi:hypothetical protein
MNGYSRYAATALWVGNSDKSLVRDGPSANYAAANTTTTLFKTWMGSYHDYLQSKGVFKTPEDFKSIQPPNVAQRTITSPTTDRVFSGGGCSQTVTAWVRTDVTYAPECVSVEIDSRNGLLASDQTPAPFRVTRQFVKLPAFHPELAVALAHARGIPIAPTEKSNGAPSLEITSLSNGKTLNSSTDIVGSVQPPGLKNWKLEIGPGQSPVQWITLGSGNSPVNNGVLGHFDIASTPDGVYTVRLTTDDGKGLSTSVTINVKRSGSGPFGPGSGSQTPQAGRTATPAGTRTIGTPTDPPNQGQGNGNGRGN